MDSPEELGSVRIHISNIDLSVSNLTAISDASTTMRFAIPAGRWILGVSGGADSVAMLRLALADRSPGDFVVGHLNHEARGIASDEDARFVVELSRACGVGCTVERFTAYAQTAVRGHELAYRRARHAFFSFLVGEHGAQGVLFAHHADDRAETVLLRLLRGGEPWAAGGLRQEATINGLRIHRPLLGMRRAELRQWLHEIGQPWREDASNATPAFARNRVRRFLGNRPELVGPLLKMAEDADILRSWARANAPCLPPAFKTAALGDLPDALARMAARRWLVGRGAPRSGLSSDAANSLIEMCRDRATPARRTFSGRLSVVRKGHMVSADA